MLQSLFAASQDAQPNVNSLPVEERENPLTNDGIENAVAGAKSPTRKPKLTVPVCSEAKCCASGDFKRHLKREKNRHGKK
jgi:hypothetical protein